MQKVTFFGLKMARRIAKKNLKGAEEENYGEENHLK